MMNYIAVEWNNFFIFAIWSERGFQMSKVFPNNAWLPRLTEYAEKEPDFSRINNPPGPGICDGCSSDSLVDFKPGWWGYEIRLIGDNPGRQIMQASRSRNIILVMVASGALAGLAGMSEISGVVHRLQGSISPGYGFTGIIVAWLAKLRSL